MKVLSLALVAAIALWAPPLHRAQSYYYPQGLDSWARMQVDMGLSRIRREQTGHQPAPAGELADWIGLDQAVHQGGSPDSMGVGRPVITGLDSNPARWQVDVPVGIDILAGQRIHNRIVMVRIIVEQDGQGARGYLAKNGVAQMLDGDTAL